MKENFSARVQYGDLKGSASADRHDFFTMEKYLEEMGLLRLGERVVGISLFSGEVRQKNQDETVYVSVFVTTDDYETLKGKASSAGSVNLRQIKLDMHLNEFFGKFKRFSIYISNGGLLDGREIVYDESE